MNPTDQGIVGTANAKPGCLTSGPGAIGLLLAAVGGPIGLLSIGSDPVQALTLLAGTCVGAALFARAWLAERRWRAVDRTIVHRRPAAGQQATPYVVAGTRGTAPGGMFGDLLRSFLDDPARLGSLVIDGPGNFFLRFAMLPTVPNVLSGEAAGPSRLDGQHQPGPDARVGLLALGWAAPPSVTYREAGVGVGPRQDFAAEWALPVDLGAFDKFIQSTIRIYRIDAALLQPRFAATPPGSAAPVWHKEATAVPSAGWDPRDRFRRWSRHPAVVSVLFVVGVLIYAAGREPFERFRFIPVSLVFGGLAVVFLERASYLLRRYQRTADPFSATGWHRLRRRVHTTYAGHVWWGILGAGSAIVGIVFLIAALASSGQ